MISLPFFILSPLLIFLKIFLNDTVDVSCKYFFNCSMYFFWKKLKFFSSNVYIIRSFHVCTYSVDVGFSAKK